jgi:hypothetical protein
VSRCLLSKSSPWRHALPLTTPPFVHAHPLSQRQQALSHLTLIGFIAILNGGETLSPFLVPLPLCLIAFYFHMQKGFYEPSLKLSLLAARRMDARLQQETEAAATESLRASAWAVLIVVVPVSSLCHECCF